MFVTQIEMVHLNGDELAPVPWNNKKHSARIPTLQCIAHH